MASLICPNCGKDNPDFLDDCQFCQTPLRREATLNIGEEPTKKSTGELEGVLPDWLKEARQQARASAEEEAAKEATSPKSREEPVDLLAGLAYQAASDEEEVPDWLAAINPIKEEKKIPEPQKPAEPEPLSDFFAQFEQPKTLAEEPKSEEPLPWMTEAGEPLKDELADWTPKSGGHQEGPFLFDTGELQTSHLEELKAQEKLRSEPAEDLGWLRDLEASTRQAPAAPAPQADADWMSNLDSASGAPEDLSWLNNLGGGTPVEPASAPAQPAASEEDLSWLSNLQGTPTEPAAAQEDLSWLNNFGGTTAPTEPATPTPDDLSWLDNLGGTSAEPAPSQPTSTAGEDLSWLDNLGGAPIESTPSQPTSTGGEDLSWLNNLEGAPVEPEPLPSAPAEAEDLSWLNNLGSMPAPAEPATPAQEDLSWLNNLGGIPAETAQSAGSGEDLSWLDTLSGVPSTPSETPATATPLSQPDMPDWLKSAEREPVLEPEKPPQFSPPRTAPLSEGAMQAIPDWLKSAMEESASAMPPLGAAAQDWFASQAKAADEASGQPQGQPVSAEQGFVSTPTESTPLANQDVDALFAVDMPDWLSQPEPTAGESADLFEGVPSAVTAGGDELAPVNLPSWVQDLRPVEAALSESAAISDDQPLEREGPLAGLRGVIPLAPIGSAQRPRALSLKLQATAEQQAGASLLEQIIAGEAVAQAVKEAPVVLSQRALRWTLAGLFLVVLSAVIALGSQFLPVSAALPVEVSNASNAAATLPEGAPVLVVMDYEPSLAGELEAATGPLLDQIASRKPVLTFLSTSPNGAGLVERLLTNTQVDQTGVQYLNAGYLPGGLAGVRGFTEAPQMILPVVQVTQFSEFAAVLLLTDQAESGQVWIEQVTLAKHSNSALASQKLLVVASAQAGPMLQPYVSSQQVAGMVTGISDAARYEVVNNNRPGIVRPYWDAFNAGLLLAVAAIVLGGLWNVFAGLRARRAETEQG